MNQLVLSLFPGIGLLDSAFEEEGFCVVPGNGVPLPLGRAVARAVRKILEMQNDKR
jgi:hypothetical protein